MPQLTTEELDAGLQRVQGSPANAGLIDMIVIRPNTDERQMPESVELAVGQGAVGDNYVARGNSSTDDGKADHEAQITIMNSRVVDLVSGGDRSLWPLAGDQLIADMDLSAANLPPGTRLSIGTAVLEVSAKPHTGCAKFARRFGLDAAKWVNSDPELRLRGINAMVVTTGSCAVGDVITKL